VAAYKTRPVTDNALSGAHDTRASGAHFRAQKMDEIFAFRIAMTVALFCWVHSQFTGNCSTVDRLWPLLPTLYAWIFADNARTVLVASLISVWCMRLVYNFYRKGGYDWATEDYRWPYVRKWFPNRIVFALFNIFFICVYQNILLLLIAMPVVAMAGSNSAPLDYKDAVLAIAFLAFFALEGICDQQQWYFHICKSLVQQHGSAVEFVRAVNKLNLSPRVRAYVTSRAAITDAERGFRTNGLFAWSRHMNFFAEQMLWWIVFAFYYVHETRSVVPVARVDVPPLAFALGTALLSMLFIGSVRLTEDISQSKYASYKRYCQQVSDTS
jgi:steroid 5-alpha reductase family enzyme